MDSSDRGEPRPSPAPTGGASADPLRPQRSGAGGAVPDAPPSRGPAAGGAALDAPRRDPRLSPRPGWLGGRMLAAVWIPVVLIGLMHYVTGAQHHWIHDILRRLYYLPIVLAAFQRGLPGGLLAAAVVSVTYLPHAFFFHARPDPAPPVEKALELVLYHAVGGVAGWLADQERRRTAELREALAEQRRLQRQLVRAGRLSALGEVVAGIAHEIKNPLHALKGTAEVVDPLVPAEAEERRLWERHRAELQRLGDVAERFLSFARPRRLASDRVDLREVVERLQDLVAAEARQQGLTLTTELPPRPVFVSGDRDQLAQVGLNIVINAFHALRAQGTLLRLGVGRGRPGPGPAEPGPAEVQGVGGNRRTMAYLRIENDGPPIPEVALEHIFDPFHSGDEEGTGLGLSISARIAEQHGGFIEVANAQPGVVFTVWLPPAPTG